MKPNARLPTGSKISIMLDDEKRYNQVTELILIQNGNHVAKKVN